MARRPRISYRPTRRAIGALVGFVALTSSMAALAYALSRPGDLWAWMLLSALVALTGVGAHLARRR